MKKKLLIALCALFILMLTLCTTAFAARVTECPFTVRHQYLDDVVVTKFEVTDVENMFSKTWKFENRIYYSCEATDYASLDIVCYDANGIPITTLNFDTYSDYIDVPDTTATIELIPNQSLDKDPNGDTFFYCKYINVYAADGRVMGITDLQAPVYEMVGWYPAVTVYAYDGRTQEISPFKVEEYRRLGWYTSPVVINVYSSDGYVMKIGAENLEAYNAVGWYKGITVYNEDGETQEISPFKVEEYRKSGWCTSPNIITVYSADGRNMKIEEENLEAYTAVGWYKGITVYNEYGSAIDISPFQVDTYAQRGWYPYDVDSIQSRYNKYKAIADYQGIIDLANRALNIYEGTDYAPSLYAMRTEAMDCWRIASGSPLPSASYKITKNSIGTPEANIRFTNVSYKPISAFRLKFTCYNIFGEVENTYYDRYHCDNAKLDPSETWTYTWTLYGADSVNTLKNIRVTEVVFSDGTKWYR